MKIRAYELLGAELFLREPYVLSFATVKSINSIVVRLGLDDGSIGMAEAVPLPGYSSETRESILSDMGRILPALVGLEADELSVFVSGRLPDSPFVVSALTVAKEVAAREVTLPERLAIPLLAPVSASIKPRRVLEKVLHWHSLGYQTIKLKVGKDIKADLMTVQCLLDEMPGDVKLRIDANQAYTLQEAQQLLHVLDHPRNYVVELLEQPFGVEDRDWDLFRKLAAEEYGIALMLDESIVTEDDVERAAEAGADLVKLKLFKQRGVAGLLSLARRARGFGMKVVLGNGVSTEIGNLLEAAAFTSGLFAGAFEGNGFIKLSCPVMKEPVRVDQGRMIWNRDIKSFSSLLKEGLFEILASRGW